MGRIGKTFALFLILAVVMSCLTLLTVKPANAQSTPIPEMTILYPVNGTFFNVSRVVVSFQLKYATNNTLSWIGYSIDGGQNKTAYGEWYDLEQRLYDTEGNPSVWVYDVFENDGNHNLTLYANNTAGDWATPQIVTYLVNIYADNTFPPTTSTPTTTSEPTSTPITPNTNVDSITLPLTLFVALIAVLVAVIVALSILAIRRHRKTISLKQ